MKSVQYSLMKKSKRSTTAAFKSSPDSLRNFLNWLLDPVKDINDSETIDWCRWLMAGGQTPEEFANEIKQYDNATICGLVWTANFVAYRCRTCRISPCMSLCAECFRNGNHDGHDFNMFRSQAGGACDCGDMSVMKETGFCGRHGPKQAQTPNAPDHLMCLPNAIMPRLILRLIQHMRENSNSRRNDMVDADAYLNMLHDFSSMGAAMRRVMTIALTDPQIYKELTESPNYNTDSEFSESVLISTQIYHQALRSLPNPEFPDEYKNCPALQEHLVHKNFLEELMFWTMKFEFPQQVVCLLLNMLPDLEYKEPLTRAFVLHYSRIPMMLEKSSTPDTLSNRVVHVSVQLFSNESLALKMTNELNLLHVMVISLKYMMAKILIPNTLHDPAKNFHLVVDCSQDVMKEHCYWPLVSDLNNVLSHQPVAYKFMSDTNLLEMWFNFLSMFQGMNVNRRELYQHVEFEPSAYYAAFSVELEGSAYPLWALISHLKDESTLDLTKNVLNGCISALQDWFDAINFSQPVMTDHRQVSFHLPLHRYLAILMNQAVKCQGVILKQILPPPYLLELIYQHPLRLQVAFYEILNGMWVRNGLQIRGQMMTYIQCNFCNSMVDEDLYLLQVCATQIDPEKFLLDVLRAFRVVEALSMVPYGKTFAFVDYEFAPAMLESCLTFLAILVHIRSNLGVSDTWVTKLEMVTLLCMGDKTHSQLMELMPERCGSGQNGDFDDLLTEIADYTAPSKMRQGMYRPKPHVWEELYDPIHVLLRAVQRKDFHTSMDRFTDYIRSSETNGTFHHSGVLNTGNIWPPLRPPAPCGEAYEDPRKVLQSRIFHAVIFCILYKAVDRRNVSEQALSLALYLLEMAIMSSPTSSEFELCQTECCNRYEVKDNDLTSFYEQDWLAHNLRTVIHNLIFIHEPEVKSECTKVKTYLESTEIGQDAGRESESGDPSPLRSRDFNIVSYKKTNLMTSMPPHSSDLPSTSQSHNTDLVPLNQTASTSSGNKSLSQSTSNNLKYDSESVVIPQVSLHVNESIISLLLKLHAQLSGTPDSYIIGQQTSDGLIDSRIGDGSFFVAKILDRIASLDEICRECILETKKKIWMKKTEENSSETKEREERKRRAKKRQQQLIEEFARKQEQFMKKATETKENYENMEWNGESTTQVQLEYHCVICNETAPSKKDSPMGLIVFVQGSSVLGYQRKSHANETLPTSDEDKRVSVREDSRANDFDKRIFELNREFDSNSWLLSVNLGWEGGVYVQTCGHHAHMACLKSYCQYLRDQERHQSVAVEKREYFCPLCRRLANSALPLVPELGEITSTIRARPQNFATQTSLIMNLLKNYASRPESSDLLEAMGKSMEDMTKCTHIRFKQKTDHPSPQSLFLFVSSIARTNLELEIVQKGGSLLAQSVESSLLPKRSCIVPLLHVLAIHGRILAQWPVWLTWQQLTQLPLEDSGTQIANIEKEVPLLLRDPTALLIQFLLFLPINLDQSYFSCLVKCLYNLLYFQILSQISVNMTEFERESWKDTMSALRCSEIKSVDAGLSFVISQLEGTSLYMDSGGSSALEENYTRANKQAIEEKVQSLCLPYLRIAALLRHYLFNEDIPEIRTESTEFVRLVYYLELVTEGMDWSKFNATVALSFTESNLLIPRMWFRDLSAFIERSQRSARNFLSRLHINWHPPKLLTLPHHYDKIFQYYHKKQCSHCHSVPREASICLLCGTLVCLREDCCKTENKHEAVQHSLDCGAGTGVFLAVSSAYIIIVRGLRACNWGSIYLDSFGEEDRDLKRGKPLYLCPERYQLLQEQWIFHQFDHNIKKWILHNNAL